VRILAVAAALVSLAAAQTPTERALNYLALEVPKWRTVNGCFSCHNNGDGARALYAAGRLDPLQSTTAWLLAPADWDKGAKNNPAYSDKSLALYQFAAALTSAVETGAIPKRDPAVQIVAARLAVEQRPDGSWRVEDEGDAPGSPVTWGTALATYFGLRTLRMAGGQGESIGRAESWLRTLAPRYNQDEAAVLLAFPSDPVLRQRALDRFTRMQTSDGGWGPGLHAPAEVFDTALVALSLQAAGETQLIPRAREFLIRSQQASGGWPETTRPAGSQSYAQHISTTAWATLALLATDPQRK
jgi:hypothetical protein